MTSSSLPSTLQPQAVTSKRKLIAAGRTLAIFFLRVSWPSFSTSFFADAHSITLFLAATFSGETGVCLADSCLASS
eukprot:2563725-Rhodomonas_salina.1